MVSTEMQLKSYVALNMPFCVTAIRCDGGYHLELKSDELNLEPVKVITTHSKSLRVFKSLDAIKGTCDRIGLKNYSINIK